ncbi:MAG: tRNA(Met) cytidine acetate ligase [Thermodesulfobacteriota bacterium]
MRAVGLITEYNPFHNGHAYHIEQARACSGAEVVVAVMGGHFLQRGEPALVDKWQRARIALSSGVDVVVELPFPWACNSAPHFAAGALEVLHAFAPHLDCFCFGSESGNLEELQRMAEAITSVEGMDAGAHHFRQGESFPAARQESLLRAGDAQSEDAAHPLDLHAPNNILGLAYLRALAAASHIDLEPLTIARIGSSFHASEPQSADIASATAVRRMLMRQEDISPYVPEITERILRQAQHDGMVSDIERWFMLVAAGCLGRGADAAQDAQIYQFQPGLRARMLQAALHASSYAELVDGVKARHLTRTRVQRLLCYVALGVTPVEMEVHLNQGVPFISLLGASARGEVFLRQCRASLKIPLAGNFSRLNALLKRHYRSVPDSLAQARQLLELHNRSSRMYSLLLPEWRGKSRHMDYARDPLRPADLG